MAVKDTAPYLPECIDSILDQSYTNWELIAVNDHSADGSEQMLASYAKSDSRIKLVQNKGHRLLAALQEGYRHISGSLINRMDSDDIMPSNKLTLMVQAWLQHGKGTVIAGGTKHFVKEGTVGGGFLRYENWLNHIAEHNLYAQEIYKECVVPSQCWLIHLEDLEAVGAFSSDVYPEDYDLCFRFYKHQLKMVGLPFVLNHWRDRNDRISRTWEEYKDNRYFDLKLRYFFELDRDTTRPLVLWGAGRNGKDLVKVLQEYTQEFVWVTNNQGQIGHDIYGIILQPTQTIHSLKKPQIIIAVSSPKAKEQIIKRLKDWKKEPIEDYWFFL